ncbi:hypothetical protein Nepgr_004779 [Nepenthes gracilis]|uniref:FAD-binding domain-containing protein n=1 Tax=Nepenthes gracilis TaxID=150966 RepID=A0AAD3XFN4_NEPGR|nr:hypothetical protein Nepgr_004779 [Nepenthes gracilis]
MESKEDIVIVGAGSAGLATALGLHRLGLKSLVIESSPCLRATGGAFTTWTNAWRALDALGIGDSLRRQHLRLDGSKSIANTRSNHFIWLEKSFATGLEAANMVVDYVKEGSFAKIIPVEEDEPHIEV